MHSILLTGASGFVGQNLLRAWQSDPHLTPVPVSLRNSLDTLNAALDPVSSIPCPASLIHLAGKAHDTRNASDPGEYFRVNTDLTKAVFDSFLTSDATTFIYFSSVKAVADRVEGEVLTEEAEPKPCTPYGQSKLEAERCLQSNPLPDGKRLYILRPCMMHGPGNKGNLNLLYHVVRKGIPWPLGSFENQRSFLSIDNLIFLLESLLKGSAPPPSGIYNLADDDPLSTNELIQLMAESMGRKPAVWRLPPGPIRAVARAGDMLRLPLNSERLKKLTESYVVSNEKLKKSLNLTSLPVSSEEGLRSTFRSFLHPSTQSR